MSIEKYISYQISKQFPAIYREDGAELVDFVKTYYEFLEQDVSGYYVTGYVFSNNGDQTKSYFARKYNTLQEATVYKNSIQTAEGYNDVKIVVAKNQSTYHNRRLLEYSDIDSTLDKMLLFFKNKFLNDLPLNEVNTRFIVKHILDLYRRKGSREGLELFFRLFYSQEVDVYYPSQDVLKPSASKWVVGRYVELLPQNPESLRNLDGLRVYGTISGATATIDRVCFYLSNNTLFPVVYLSNIDGTFVGYDQLIANGITYGTIRGSLQSVDVSGPGAANNFVGDIVEITSATGFGGKARVSSVSRRAAGDINFSVINGGFGYTLTNTDILISDQVLILNTGVVEFKELESVSQTVTGATGIVIGQRTVTANTSALGILVTSSNSFIDGVDVSTVDRPANISKYINFAGPRNSSASADVGTINNTQTIYVIRDLIGNFLSVPLNANNYSDVPPALVPMSGGSANLSTVIADAFIESEVTIGSIETLTGINPGIGYVNDVFVLARENEFSRYNLNDQVIVYDVSTPAELSVGSIIVQNDPSGNTTNLDIKGIVRGWQEGVLDVVQLSFTGFSTSSPIYLEDSDIPIYVLSVSRDTNTLPLGLNAEITGSVSPAVGKILSVDVFDSGVGFLHRVPASLKNKTKIQEAQALLDALNSSSTATPEQIADAEASVEYYTNLISATGTTNARGQGMTEGAWKNKTSHLNSKKRIQDSFYYQDFSYEIISSLAPNTYEQTLKDITHVAGTMLFHGFSLKDDINTGIDVSSTIDIEV